MEQEMSTTTALHRVTFGTPPETSPSATIESFSPNNHRSCCSALATILRAMVECSEFIAEHERFHVFKRWCSIFIEVVFRMIQPAALFFLFWWDLTGAESNHDGHLLAPTPYFFLNNSLAVLGLLLEVIRRNSTCYPAHIWPQITTFCDNVVKLVGGLARFGLLVGLLFNSDLVYQPSTLGAFAAAALIVSFYITLKWEPTLQYASLEVKDSLHKCLAARSANVTTASENGRRPSYVAHEQRMEAFALNFVVVDEPTEPRQRLYMHIRRFIRAVFSGLTQITNFGLGAYLLSFPIPILRDNHILTDSVASSFGFIVGLAIGLRTAYNPRARTTADTLTNKGKFLWLNDNFLIALSNFVFSCCVVGNIVVGTRSFLLQKQAAQDRDAVYSFPGSQAYTVFTILSGLTIAYYNYKQNQAIEELIQHFIDGSSPDGEFRQRVIERQQSRPNTPRVPSRVADPVDDGEVKINSAALEFENVTAAGAGGRLVSP